MRVVLRVGHALRPRHDAEGMGDVACIFGLEGLRHEGRDGGVGGEVLGGVVGGEALGHRERCGLLQRCARQTRTILTGVGVWHYDADFGIVLQS